MKTESGSFTRLKDIKGERSVGKIFPTAITVNLKGLPDFTNPDGTSLQDRIGLNLRAIHRRALTIGGVRNLRIVGVEGKATSSMPLSGGVNAEGAHEGLRVGIRKKAKLTDIEQYGDTRTIKVNLREIRQRIEANKEPIRSADAWARELNNAIEVALWKHQLDSLKQNIPTKYGMFAMASEAALALMLGIAAEDAAVAMGVFVPLSLFAHCLAAVMSRIDRSDGIFHPFPLERFVVAGIYAGKDKLIGTKKNFPLVRAMQPPQTK